MGGSHPLPVSLMLSPQPFGPFFIPISFVPLLYHTLRGLSRGFLHFFSWLFPVCVVVLRFLLTAKGTFPKLGTRSFLLTPLLYHNLGNLSRGNFRGCPAFCYSPANSLGRASSAFPLAWLRFPLPLPLTPLVYHKPYQKSTGNVAQIRDF